MSQTLNIHQKINLRALAREFPPIAKKEMGDRFRKLKIGQTGELQNTMTYRGKLLVNGVLLEIDYWYYGIFTALGVGKGMSQGDVAVARLVGSGRKRRNWMVGVGHARHRLGELYSQIAADEISQHVNGTYDRTLRFKL